MVYKAKEDFLWFKVNDVIPENEENLDVWLKKGHVVELKGADVKQAKAEPEEEKESVLDKVKDLLDDGKLNKSYKKGKSKKR